MVSSQSLASEKQPMKERVFIMSKKSFVFLILTVMAGLLFGLGMCMCLLPDWSAFAPGVAVTALGTVSLLAIAAACWRMAGKPLVKVDWKKAGKIVYCVVAALVLGTGMAMVMVLPGLMIPGIIVGIAGIVLGICAIPVCKGLK